MRETGRWGTERRVRWEREGQRAVRVRERGRTGRRHWPGHDTHVEGFLGPAGVQGVGVVGAGPHQMVRVVDATDTEGEGGREGISDEYKTRA